MQTALYAQHLAAGAKMVDFAGWDMPIHYGSQLEEHQQVRQDAGVFDVSHMRILDLAGSEAKPFLQYLLANDVTKLTQSGKALYSCMLNEQSGVIDDLIVYYLSDTQYRLVVNAGTAATDLMWMQAQAKPFQVQLTERADLSMVAVQGPNAQAKVLPLLPMALQAPAAALSAFHAVWAEDWFVAYTGYTGEAGFEIMLPTSEVVAFWQRLLAAGVKPIGLGARDTLRLEAGMNLYGVDMNEHTSPLVSGLGWTIAWQPESRDFIGRSALMAQKKAGVQQQFVGLVLEGKGVLRSHMRVVCDNGEGEITSGTFSPTLKLAIALARIPVGSGEECQVEVRGKLLPARIVKPSFVRHGKAVIRT